MRVRNMIKLACLVLLISSLAIGGERKTIGDQPAEERPGVARAISVADCDFNQNPDRYLFALRRTMEELSSRTERVARSTAANYLPPGDEKQLAAFIADVPHRSYIDDYIFDKMAADNIPHAPLCSDAEYMRRVTLDLTGRIPAPSEIRAFLNDDSSKKRSSLVKTLMGSSEFVDRWTMYYGDLLKNTSRDNNVVRFPEGRNAFYQFIKNAVQSAKPYDIFVKEIITGSGDSYTAGEANWAVGGSTPMGPIQDTYDTLMVRSATQFLGLSNFDCLLCHSGAGHLESLNLWAAGMQRSQAWEMSAFFSRVRMQRVTITQTPLVYSWNVTDSPTGNYLLNTSSGNRTARQPSGSGNTVTPRYIFAGSQATGGTYREMLANNLTRDRQFARATVNYLWKEMMGMGIVEPADQFDLSRLDPANPPPAEWTIQPSHPELLEALTDDFIKNGYDVRYLLNLIADSSAYQLSSRFTGEWREEYTAYFARKFARRLTAEEVHDAIARATGIPGAYTVQGFSTPITWAMQLPDTQEPRGNGAVTTFLNYFLRGDRDANFRSSDATILQALNMMNNTFVTSRIRNSNANTTVSKLLAQALSDDQLIQELFLGNLGRFPTTAELSAARNVLKPNRTTGAESLNWVLLNKIDFLYNY